MPVAGRFFFALIVGLAAAAALYAALLFGQMGAPSADSAWAREINARKLAAARAIAGPKLLVAGGSGALFGVKARQLETALHLPAINLSSHAALGTSYVLDLARRVATHGDTVLLIPEYELYEYGDATVRAWADPVYLDYMMAAEPARLRQLPLLDCAALALRVPTARLAEGWRNRSHSPAPRIFSTYHPYDPANVDDHGDMTGHRADCLPEKSRGPLGISETLAHGLTPQRSGLRDLTAFCLWAKAHDIRVLAALPVICDQPEYHRAATLRTVEEIAAFWRGLGVPLLDDFPATLLPRRDFFDTHYHLTEAAAALRTTRLSDLLSAQFNAERR